MGPSRCSNISSEINAATSAPTPPVLATDSGLEQALGIIRIRWGHHLQSRHIEKPGLRTRGVKCPAMDKTAERRPDHHRGLPSPAVVILRRDTHNLVKGTGDKISKLHLDNRPHPHQCGPNGCPGQPGLRKGGIKDPPLTILFIEPLGDTEGAAIVSYILP